MSRISAFVFLAAGALALGGCGGGSDLTDPETVGVAVAEALFVDRDCDAAAEFADEGFREQFLSVCDGDDYPTGTEIADSPVEVIEQGDDRVEVIVPLLVDGVEETVEISLEKNGDGEWETIAG